MIQNFLMTRDDIAEQKLAQKVFWEEIEIPESFVSWTTLTYEEREAMNLGEIRKERK